MGVAGSTGPIIAFGQNPPIGGTGYQPDYNGDRGPSAFDSGIMLLDARYGFRPGLQANALQAVGFFGMSVVAIDQVPSTIAVANIAAAANVVSGTPMTLVAATGAGITVSTAALTIPQSGVTAPVGTRFIDGLPAVILFGQNGSLGAVDPRTMIGRAVSITGSASATGGNMVVRGLSPDGFPISETIAAPAGATTVNGKKGYKAVFSVTPAFTDAHNYSVGTTDIYEFPLMVTNFAQVEIFWNNAVITANTGFLAADTTSPATATTGSVRGTYATQSASDGTKRLIVIINVMAYNAVAVNGAASLYGVAQFTN